jgi:hypothetical protein
MDIYRVFVGAQIANAMIYIVFAMTSFNVIAFVVSVAIVGVIANATWEAVYSFLIDGMKDVKTFRAEATKWQKIGSIIRLVIGAIIPHLWMAIMLSAMIRLVTLPLKFKLGKEISKLCD